MFQISKRQFSISLLIAVFALGIVSPACAKLWGGGAISVLEICTSQGIERIALNGEELPADEKTSTGDHCPFCQTYNAALTSGDVSVSLKAISYELPEITAQDRLISGLTITKPHQTGPPLFLLS